MTEEPDFAPQAGARPFAWGHGPRLMRFLFTGMLNTAVGYSIYFVGLTLGAKPAIALAVATALGALFNYFSTGRLVFQSRGMSRLPRFILAYVVIYGFNLLLLQTALTLGAAPWLAQILVLPIVVIASYLLLNFVVFAVRPVAAER
jgi:putative flippase GtrA